MRTPGGEQERRTRTRRRGRKRNEGACIGGGRKNGRQER